MSALVMGLVWELEQTPEFGRAEKTVLLAYADHADSNGRNIYPSIALMCRKTFYEERSVQKTTRGLEALGLLIADGVGPHGTNRWRIPVVHDAGGAKIAPVVMDAKNAPEENAPEENAPEPSLVVSTNTYTDAPDFSKMSVQDAYRVKTLQVFRDATKRFPGQPTWEYIDRMVRTHSLSAEKIKEAFEAWSLRGYNTGNVEGFLEWAVNGIPAKGAKGARHGTGNNRTGGEKPVQQKTEYSDADRAAAARVKARRASVS